jgi:hypothetical protein
LFVALRFLFIFSTIFLLFIFLTFGALHEQTFVPLQFLSHDFQPVAAVVDVVGESQPLTDEEDDVTDSEVDRVQRRLSEQQRAEAEEKEKERERREHWDNANTEDLHAAALAEHEQEQVKMRKPDSCLLIVLLLPILCRCCSNSKCGYFKQTLLYYAIAVCASSFPAHVNDFHRFFSQFVPGFRRGG